MKQIRLSKGLFALVDDIYFEWLNQWKWCASEESRGTKFYAIRRKNGVKIRMHHQIMWENGYAFPKPGFVVDHINHNSLDNRRENLEIVTQTENMNRSRGWKKKGQKYVSSST